MNEKQTKKNKNKALLGGIIVAAALIVAGFTASLFIEKIPNGYVGVVYSPNGGVKSETLDQGWHFVGLFDKVTKYPVRMQTVNNQDIQVATSDGKNISMDIAYNYVVQPDKVVELFNKFGAVDIESIENSYLKTRLWDAARKSISKYSVIDTYGQKSSDAAAEVQKTFADDMKRLGFVIDDLTLGVPKPDKATQEAIDARVKSSQELERTQTELKIAEAEAKKKKIEAEGIAEYNEIIKKSMSDEMIQYQWIQKWDGKMPKATGSNSLIQLPKDDAGK
ncbi:prohibitin family protein [Bacillus swezeyi]|uniref:Prohibitin family protein n=1 Tax=Bacillus swezeyi TaxID=1925020 RepID=A0A5M8RTR3_9BACI|nr:prohibitin family protein [Bacillus swezeyi]KAA6452015.1 prohibitin family protein [Bacillus swezeyi]KAA6473702.1 prohibitin family protein [Bacillus swezeyi]TYS36236.1 prohibitin family protein [Bacillus swezeyi]